MNTPRTRYLVSLAGVLVVATAIACGGSEDATATAPPAAAQQAAPTAAAPTPAQQTAPSVAAPTSAPAQSASVESAAFTWEFEDVGRGTKPALALSTDGTPNVAFMLEAMPGFVKNAVRNGASWDVTTVAEGYFYGPLDLAIGPDDEVHITYHDHQEATFQPDKGDAVYATLASLEADGWQVRAVFDGGHDGWDNRITVDAQGRPHMSAIDPRDFDGDGVEYYFRDDAGDWQVETIGTGPLTYQFATAIAIDPDGTPHIAYHDQRDGDLALASRGDSGWSIQTVDSEGETGKYSSLVITPDGRFHISYLTKTGNRSGMVKYATRGPGDTAWQISEIDTLDGLTFGFVGARNITSVAVDTGGRQWVAYSDESVIKLAGWDGSGWQTETVLDAGDKTLGQLVSLKLDSADHAHIAYFEVTDKTPLDGMVRYIKGTPR